MTSTSSIARRDPLGFDQQPAIALRQIPNTHPERDLFANEARESGMCLTPFTKSAPIPLVKSLFVIGRSPDCDLQVHDSSISGRHCELRFDGFEWTIKDLNSRNGIRINGEIVRKQILKPGDTLVIGSHFRLRFNSVRPVGTSRLSRYHILAAILVILAIGSVAAAFWFWSSSR
jgi:predicted component of type VI protein secretion system